MPAPAPAPAWALTGNAGTNPSADFVGTTDNEPLVVKTNGKERIRIDTKGNVGIGTTSPIAELHITGSSTLTDRGLLTVTQGQSGTALQADNQSTGIGVCGTSSGGGTGVLGQAGTAVFGDSSFASGGIGLRGKSLNGTAALLEETGTTGKLVSGRVSGVEKFSVGNSGNLFASGSVGIGTASPQKPLDVAGSGGIRISQNAQASSANEVYFADNGQIRSLDDNHRVIFNRASNDLELREYGTITFSSAATQGQRTAQVVVGSDGNMYISNNLGIALTQDDTDPARGNEPSSPLVVHGDVRIIGGGNLTVSGDVFLTGADCAENFDAVGTEAPEPGTVVVIDEGGALRESREPYDRKVAGVVSGAGDFRHALVLDTRKSENPRIPVALMGKVYCKIDAQYGAIEIGDLLTTSATPGHAMKAAEPNKAFGAIIGKALKSLDTGTGLIPILITLQ